VELFHLAAGVDGRIADARAAFDAVGSLDWRQAAAHALPGYR